MTSPSPLTLDYAPVPQIIVRPWPLALGTSLIAVSQALILAQSLLLQYLLNVTGLRGYYITQLLAALAERSAVLAAVLLLIRALPRRDATAWRWPAISSLACAALHWLLDISLYALLVVLGPGLGGRPYPAWFLLAVAASWIGQFCGLVLIVTAGAYLAAVGTRLQHKSLGRAAACALLPMLGLDLYHLTRNAILLPALLSGRPASLWRLPTWVIPAFQTYQLLLWTLLALSALLLALSRRPHNIQTSAPTN